MLIGLYGSVAFVGSSSAISQEHRPLRLYHMVYDNSPLCKPLLRLYNRLTRSLYDGAKSSQSRDSQPSDVQYIDFILSSPTKFSTIGLHTTTGTEHPSPTDGFNIDYTLDLDGEKRTLHLHSEFDNTGGNTNIVDDQGKPFGYSVWRSDGDGYLLTKWPGYQTAVAAIAAKKKEYLGFGKDVTATPFIELPAIVHFVQQQLFNNTRGENFLLMQERTSIPTGKIERSHVALIRINNAGHEDVCYLSMNGTLPDDEFQINVMNNFEKK